MRDDAIVVVEIGGAPAAGLHGSDAGGKTMGDGLDKKGARTDAVERKLDQFIDTQSATNQLVERRLTALEPRSAEE
jgi:hypothetical protein